MSDQLTIHYFRPPARRDTYQQQILYRDADVIVSLNTAAVTKEAHIDGVLALEPGSPIIWFTFRDEKFDVGRFHLRDGTFTGLYSDIIEPVRFRNELEVDITDLYVDVWIAADGSPSVQDVDELEHATSNGWITPAAASDALAEAHRLVRLYEDNAWPPRIVNEWPLSRVRKNP